MVQDLRLLRGDVNVAEPHREPAPGRIAEAQVLQVVQEGRRLRIAHPQVAVGDDLADPLFGQQLVIEGVFTHSFRNDLVEEHPTRRGDDETVLDADIDLRMEPHPAVVVGHDHFVQTGEEHALARVAGLDLGHVVTAQHHVLAGHGDRTPVGRVQNVLGRQHEQPGLQLGLEAQGYVNRHLVAVEVCVERRADQRVQPDRLALHHERLERLDAQTVQRGRAVEHHRVVLDDLLDDAPDHLVPPLHHAFGGLDRFGVLLLDELAYGEGLEELNGHVLGQAALVQLQLGADHDHASAGIVHALAQQVLAEPALLALQVVRKALQRAVAIAAHGNGFTAIVIQAVHRLLQHALLVAQNHFGGADLDEPLQPVVPDDDTAIEVVQVAGGKTAALQGDQRAQIRRNYRDHRKHHPLGADGVFAGSLPESLHHAKTLDRVLLALDRGFRAHLAAQLPRQLLDIQLPQQLPRRLAAGLGDEPFRVVLRELGVHPAKLLHQVEVLGFGDEVVHLLVRVARLDNDVVFVVNQPFQLAHGEPQQVTDLAGQGLEEPDVDHRHGQLDVAHALAAHVLAGHLHAATVADDALVANAAVLAAMALPVLGRAEDLFAEKPLVLGLVRAVVDRLRLGHLAVGTGEDHLRAGHVYRDLLNRLGVVFIRAAGC